MRRAETPARALLLALALVGSAPASAYKLLGSAWDADRGPVVYNLEPSGSDDIDDGSDLTAVREAFRNWSCVTGSRIRFVEGDEPGVKDNSFDDGLNSVFWDETGEFGLGPATLGVAYGNGGPGGADGGPSVRTAAAIAFNGLDHTWSTSDNAPNTDVASIAIHESGHFLGLAHSCNDDAETDCLPADESVMNPAYPGGAVRDPFDDDQQGIRALYPSADESRCDGPYRQGEACSCNGECIVGLLCTEALDDTQICAPQCSSENIICPVGFACVLGHPATDGPTPGTCLRLPEGGLKPAGSACDNDRECDVGLCALAEVLGRRICRVRCESTDDCPEQTECDEGLCFGKRAEGIACPDDGPPPACGCGAVSTGSLGAPSAAPTSPVWGMFALIGLLCGGLLRGGRSRLRHEGPRPHRRDTR